MAGRDCSAPARRANPSAWLDSPRGVRDAEVRPPLSFGVLVALGRCRTVDILCEGPEESL